MFTKAITQSKQGRAIRSLDFSLESRVSSLGSRVSGFEFRVLGLGSIGLGSWDLKSQVSGFVS